MQSVIDPKSIAGKELPVAERTQLLVLGGGPAGLEAAIAGARAGLKVMLVDENPVDAGLMALDVPLHYGQRMDGQVRNRARMTEQIVAGDRRIEAAFEAGVDVRLATYVWGVFANRDGVRWLPGMVAGLADDSRSWLVGFDRIVVAAGRRDLALAFPGWQLPGVMGAAALAALLRRYRAFDGRRVLILGTGAEALDAALTVHAAGLEVAGLVEVAAAPVGPPALVDQVRARGVPIFASSVVLAAEGTDGVRAARIAALDGALNPVAGSERMIACDTICQAVGAVPNVEALNVLGCDLAYCAALGGFVPAVDADLETTTHGVHAAGDCLGIHAAKTLDPAIAGAEGRRAAMAAAVALGAIDRADCERRAGPPGGAPAAIAETYRTGWMRALMNASGGDVPVCQCEEVSRADLLGVQPPRYLGARSARVARRSLASLAAEGPPNQDQIKRLTRAGMGPCQGRRCREQIALMLAVATGAPVERIPLAGYRVPLRPLPLGLMQAAGEAPAMAEHWDIWFGIPTQFLPPHEIDKAEPERQGYGK